MPGFQMPEMPNYIGNALVQRAQLNQQDREFGLQQQQFDRQNALAQQQLSMERAKQMHDSMVQVAQGLLRVPEAQRAQVWGQVRGIYADSLPPQLVAGLDQQPEVALSTERLSNFLRGVGGQTDEDLLKRKRDETLAGAAPSFHAVDTGGATTGINFDPGASLFGGQQATQLFSAKKTASPDAVLQANTSRANNRDTNAAEDRRAGLISGQPVGVPGAPAATGDQYLGTLPKNIALQVKALAEGRMQFPSGFALKSPYWQQMLQAVAQYDPNFDAVNYNARAATRRDFTSGQSARNVTALNTVIGHLDSLDRAISGLNNSSFTTYNAVANAVSGATGNPSIRKFTLIKQAVADELEKAFRGTGGSVEGIRGWQSQFDAASSPQQLREAVKTAVDLLNSRIDAVSQTYSRGMGTTSDGVSLLSPKARKTYQRLSQEYNDAGQPAAGAAPAGIPAGWTLHVDGQGNKAYVSPDGKQFKEVQ